MKNIRAIIVDDEQTSILNLSELLNRYCPDVQLVATANNIDDAETAVVRMEPDLLFLDVELPSGNGFELLQRISGLPTKVIFVTAFDHYAVKAFRSNAADYLLKPLDVDQLIESVEKIKTSLGLGSSTSEAVQTITGAPQKIMLPSVNGFELLEVDKIIYLESSRCYTYVYARGDAKYIFTKNIGELEKMLPAHTFLRIHNEHIVNVNEITRYVKGRGGYVILKNGQHLDVSYRRKKSLLERLGH